MSTTSFGSRIAAAPISWGVCEVPGWGLMLPAGRVLREMTSLGLTATELGAPGFLPSRPDALMALLREHGVSLIGGFVPLVLHRPETRADALLRAIEAARLFQACGAQRFVTAVVMDYEWSRPVPLDAAGMKLLGEGLAAVDEICDRFDLVQAVHPHVDTLIETARDVELALQHTTTRWCLDTGHLRIGGVDPVAFARDAGERVVHVHLKDVDGELAADVLRRDLTLLQGVQSGLFRPLGEGDVDIAGVILELERNGYHAWHVLEQDTAITDGVPPEGHGPIDEVRRSIDFLAHAVAPHLVP
jgi:inosose dehydratase